MPESILPQKFKKDLERFIRGLSDIYKDDLVSVILYGSLASGEFSSKHSNVNIAIVLNDTTLNNIAKISKLLNFKRYRRFNPIFLTGDYIRRSSDVFPIEFLDMKENHILLYGKDVLKDLDVDMRNLRFQCEQELKAKLINVKRLYLRILDRSALQNLLFRSLTSVLHILRNSIRLKGRAPSYSKEDVLKEVAGEFRIDLVNFNRILAAKNRNLSLRYKEVDLLFQAFVKDLEKITDIVDRL